MKFNNVLKNIPDCYFLENEHKGKVERIDYKATNYDGRKMDKHCYVYTPYGYDEAKEYEILYLIHGGGETAEKYLFENGEENKLKRVVDNMIDNGDIKPILICTPCQYPDNEVVHSGEGNELFVEYFHNELVEELMPVVEKKYHTYAKSADVEGFISSREKRAVMGWSMGAFTTWSIFLNRLNCFNRFSTLSCYYGLIADPETIEWADEKSKYMVEEVKKQGYEKTDYQLFVATGTLDKTYEKLVLEMAALSAYPDTFDFNSDDRNIVFLMWPDGEHHTYWRQIYTYNAIKQFFGE